MDSETQKTEALYDFLGWLETNKKQVAMVAGAAVLIVGIIATVMWFRGQEEFRASEALSAIYIPVVTSNTLAPDTLDKLQKVISDYSGTAAAARAELIRAGLLYTTGRYADAQAAFEKFVRDHPENQWVSEAYYGLAVCWDAQNKTNDAIAKYGDFVRRFPSDPKVDPARLHLATLFEAVGKPADAVKEYDQVVKAAVPSPFQGEAQERLRRLLIKYPNLAPTTLPPLTPTPPSLATTGVIAAPRPGPVLATSGPVIPKPTLPAVPATNAVIPKPPAAPAPPR